MATSKPPWSQYEGIAAMFKIGNSKELPTIPDNLSDDGKDFVRKCLQRNPQHRPTAAQLLDHPFVKNAAPLERPILGPDHLDPLPSGGVINGVKSMGIGHTRNFCSSDSERLAVHSSRISKTGPLSSDSYDPRNISCPVSPTGSPLVHSRSAQPLNGRMSPSPISSPHTTSGSSTPLTGGSGSIPLFNSGFSGMQSSLYLSGPSYHDSNPSNMFGGLQPVFPDKGGQFGRAGQGQSVLADRVSQQLLRDHTKMNLSLDLSPRSRTNGI